jgi:thiol-disulfide isomerase/thioredoxin
VAYQWSSKESKEVPKMRSVLIALGSIIVGLAAIIVVSATRLNRQIVPVNPQDAKPAPELADGVWVNSKPLSIKALRGQVVLVDFWTFACYNCRNTLPSLKQWDRKYRDQGLTIVGVHSPELEEEKSLDNLRKAVLSLGITYPVVTDNDYNSWNAYGVQAWPTQVLVDKQGRIRWMHVGEGNYAEAEAAIRQLLAE